MGAEEVNAELLGECIDQSGVGRWIAAEKAGIRVESLKKPIASTGAVAILNQ